MTNEQWKAVEEKLSSPFGHAKLKVDGYNLSIGFVKASPCKFYLMVYIDGVFKGEWLTEDCEIRRRFCHQRKKQVFTAKQKAEYTKKFGKRAFEGYVKEHANLMAYTIYEPYFGTFRTLKSHLIKNNKSIEPAD